MKRVYKNCKKIFFIFTALLAAFFLYTAVISTSINRYILNPEFHKQLSEKNNIYYYTENALRKSISTLTRDIEKSSPQVTTQFKNIFYAIENILTPEMVKLNLNNFWDGIFSYFKGDNAFLPDIILTSSELPDFESYDDEILLEDDNSVLSASIIKNIDKINLGVILNYINRTDISDYFMTLKLAYRILNFIPPISLLAFILILSVSTLSFSRLSSQMRWLHTSVTIGGLLCLITSILLTLSAYYLTPDSLYPFFISVPLDIDIISSYLETSVKPIYIFLAYVGLMMTFLPHVLPYIYKKLFRNRSITQALYFSMQNKQNLKLITEALKNKLNTYKIKKLLSLILLLITTVSFSLSVYAAGKDLASEDLSFIIEKLKRRNTYIKVIPAENENIYALLLKVVERNSDEPVENIEVNIIGKSKEKEKYFNELGSTSKEGIKFILDRGNFRCSFINSQSIQKYILPSPFFFELNETGTTVITVYLDKKAIQSGIVEVEVLDEDYEPVEGIKIKLNNNKNEISDESLPLLHAVTNAAGFGVFKPSQGLYELEFVDSLEASEYILPPSFNLEVKPGQKDRYTICLVKRTNSE